MRIETVIFTAIFESIQYIRRKNRQKVSTETIFNLLRTKDHCRDFSTSGLEEKNQYISLHRDVKTKKE